MMEIGSVFAVAQQLLEMPQAKAAAGAVLAWIGEKVFSGNAKTQEQLKQLEQRQADAATIAKLEGALEFVLGNNAELRQELEKKVSALEQLLKQSGVGLPASVSQTHCDNVGFGLDKVEMNEIELPDQPSNLKDFFFPLVEFLGILVPGATFMFLLIPSFIVPVQLIIKIINKFAVQFPYGKFFHTMKAEDFFVNSMNSINYSTELKEIFVCSVKNINNFDVLIFFFVSYVVGHIFYRQSIDDVDFSSFLKTSRRYKETGPVKLEKDEYDKHRGLRIFYEKICHYLKREKISVIKEAKFPYKALYRFLKERKMNYLLDKIPWDHNDKDDKTTKYFINSIKIRLDFLFPKQYIKIQKNEANVRLMSSVWYVLSSITYVSFVMTYIILFLPMIIYVISPFFLRIEIDIYYQDIWISLLYLSIPIIILIFFCNHLKVKIEVFLHHQRVREIASILELAYFINVLFPKYKIWHGWIFFHHSDVEGTSENDTIHK